MNEKHILTIIDTFAHRTRRNVIDIAHHVVSMCHAFDIVTYVIHIAYDDDMCMIVAIMHNDRLMSCVQYYDNTCTTIRV